MTIAPQLQTEKGWTQVIIDDNCEFSKFYKAAEVLQTSFDLVFTGKLDDFDSIYWDFDYRESQLCLHYNVFLGVSIFPRSFKNATSADNERVVEIGSQLFLKLIDIDWIDVESGKTINTTGSENGTIICDFEHLKGARITLEKDCGDIPFAITLGIFGLMLHTHFEREYETASDYIVKSKIRINKIFELYEVSMERQGAFWQEKVDGLLNELADMTHTPFEKKGVQDSIKLKKNLKGGFLNMLSKLNFWSANRKK